jgi:predicted dehydrogenase
MILLVGAGPMALSYVRVCEALNQQVCIVGRSDESAIKFEKESGHEVFRGGLAAYFGSVQHVSISHAIVCVSVEQLASCTISLIKHGVKNILVEKPVGLDAAQIKQVVFEAQKYDANVFVGYNRRFYSSVLAAKKIIEQDYGVSSYHFEVSERSWVIQGLEKHKSVKENWFLANTTHVVDLAFFLGGEPEILHSFMTGKTDWHSRSAIFSGAGQSIGGALFSYMGNWNAPGGWGLEILTNKRRLIFKPLEKLFVQELGSSVVNEFLVDSFLDTQYKPGLYLQVKSFLEHDKSNICSIVQHQSFVEHYLKIAGYN